MEKLVATAIGIFIGVVALFVIYCMFFIIPVAMYTEAKCLRNGFPHYHVTVGLETYCSNLDGSVTIRVEKLK